MASTDSHREDWRKGIRTGAPLALAAGVLAISFGAFASCKVGRRGRRF